MPFYSEAILYLLPTRIFLHLLSQVWALLGQAHDSLTKAFLGLCDNAGSAWCLGSLWTTPSQSLMYGPTSTGFQYLHQALQTASRTKQQWLFDCDCSEDSENCIPKETPCYTLLAPHKRREAQVWKKTIPQNLGNKSLKCIYLMYYLKCMYSIASSADILKPRINRHS